MKFSDFSKVYNEVFPKVEPVASKVVTTATRQKNIAKEIEEEIVDNGFIEEPKPKPVLEERIEENGTGADNQLNNE